MSNLAKTSLFLPLIKPRRKRGCCWPPAKAPCVYSCLHLLVLTSTARMILKYKPDPVRPQLGIRQQLPLASGIKSKLFPNPQRPSRPGPCLPPRSHADLSSAQMPWGSFPFGTFAHAALYLGAAACYLLTQPAPQWPAPSEPAILLKCHRLVRSYTCSVLKRLVTLSQKILFFLSLASATPVGSRAGVLASTATPGKWHPGFGI